MLKNFTNRVVITLDDLVNADDSPSLIVRYQEDGDESYQYSRESSGEYASSIGDLNDLRLMHRLIGEYLETQNPG